MSGVAPAGHAQAPQRGTILGTVTDATGAVIRGARARLERVPAAMEQHSDAQGRFGFNVPAGKYVLEVEADGFAAYRSKPLTVHANGQVYAPVRLAVARVEQEIDVATGDGAGEMANDTASGGVFEGKGLELLSNDSETLQHELTVLAGGGTPVFLIDGFSGGRLPPKTAIRSIRINTNRYSAAYAEMGGGRVEIATKPGSGEVHGQLELAGTDQPLNANNPYTPLQPPYYEWRQNGSVSGPLGKKMSYFASDDVLRLANNAVVNAADPVAAGAGLSEAVPAPQRTETYSLRVDRQFGPGNYGHVRDEWSRTRVSNDGILPLLLPEAAYSSGTLANTLQLVDTQSIGASAVNEVRFQYLRTRVRRDPNSTLPSVLVQGAFVGGGSVTQALRDNQDAFEAQELFETQLGKHGVRAGVRVRAVRDANESTAGFNGGYVFADYPSYAAGVASQYGRTVGQAGAVVRSVDAAVYAEDDWKPTANLTLSYGLRLESQSGIPDHADPAPRVGFAWAVRPGKRKTPIVTVRGGYGLFYDRFPLPQLVEAARQDGVREVAYLAQNTGFNPGGAPPGVVLTGAEATVYRLAAGLRSPYAQAASLTVIRGLGRWGTVSGNLVYAHTAHDFLTRNANAPLPGSGLRPLGATGNVYEFSDVANGNLERFYVNHRLQITPRLLAFGVFAVEKNYAESDGIAGFTSNGYDVRADYGRAAVNRRVNYTGGLQWALPRGVEAVAFLAAESGLPFNVITGTDLNGDTVFNDRPGAVVDPSRGSVVRTALGSFDVAPMAGQPVVRRNSGSAPAFVWLDLRVSKEVRLGPLPKAVAAGGGKPDRPWTWSVSVDAQNLTNHTNPGLPVGAISAGTVCTGAVCGLAPSPYFGHSLSLQGDLASLTASNRLLLLQTSFSW